VFKKLANIGGVVLLVAFLIATLAFTSMKYAGVPCQAIRIEYDPDDVITLDKDLIRRVIKRTDKDIIGKMFDQIDADTLEKALEKQPAILRADIFKTVARDSVYSGVLNVRIKHRVPVLRVITDSESYYMDAEGNRFPASRDYPANVLVATGKISESFAREQLLPCVAFINADDFWKAQIEQINVQADGDVLLTPLIGNQIIELGPPDNLEEKFRYMKAFYKDVLADNNWNKYKWISLKYKNQVIAKRK
jgi:cell division protein FtsQ